MMTHEAETVTENGTETNAENTPQNVSETSAVATAEPCCESTAPVEGCAVEVPTEQPNESFVTVSEAPAASVDTPVAITFTAPVQEQAAPAQEQPAPVATSPVGEQTPEPIVPVSRPTPSPMAVQVAQAHRARKATKNEAPAMEQFDAQPSGAVATAQRPRTMAPERPAYNPAPQFVEPKYATYSKSEVDYMMKQQAESILSALSGKVAAQQRAFQESVTAQEKSFNKLCDNFLAQFETARVKLESTANSSREMTKGDLEEFHKQLSKELDQYRSQVSKIVAKSDNKQANAVKEQPKQANIPPKAQAVLTAGQQKLQQMVTLTLVISAVSAVLSLVSLMSHAH